MSRVTHNVITFDAPATVAEMIEALEDLRAQYGPEARVRVTGFMKGNDLLKGPHVKTVMAEPSTKDKDNA
jgi:hypothetical protein